jgi:hypothetical protein
MIIRLLIILVLTLGLSITAVGQARDWQQRVDYRIDVELIDSIGSLEGFASITYVNNSPDTLTFLWFHIWPNAFRNDATAFSNHLLRSGNTDFYFSSREAKGYINRLDFRDDNRSLAIEEHPQHNDIIKVLLRRPLAPNSSVVLTTPFHVKLPSIYSGLGRIGSYFQIVNWYPKPAVYDAEGWHPIPYLHNGGEYANFGDYNVTITVPARYTVASTGHLKSYGRWLQDTTVFSAASPTPAKNRGSAASRSKSVKSRATRIAKSTSVQATTYAAAKRTLEFEIENANDFAWFAAKNYKVHTDTVSLASGKQVQLFVYNRQQHLFDFSDLKQLVRARSDALGDYNYQALSIVESKHASDAGISKPGIVFAKHLNLAQSFYMRETDASLFYGINSQWLGISVAHNSRRNAWLGHGISGYLVRGDTTRGGGSKLHPERNDQIAKASAIELASLGMDQPVATPVDSMAPWNVGLFTNYRSIAFFQSLESLLGRPVFDSALKSFYQTSKFRHPNTADLRSAFENVSGRDLSSFFATLDSTSVFVSEDQKRNARANTILPVWVTPRPKKLNWLPAIGYNTYDGIMPGIAVSNHVIPFPSVRFYAAPVFAIESKQVNGVAGISYRLLPRGRLQSVYIDVDAISFSTNAADNGTGDGVFARVVRIAPSIRAHLRPPSVDSRVQRVLEFKTFLINERDIEYTFDGTDFIAEQGSWTGRYINQLSYQIKEDRALYPYDATFQIQQGDGFYRASVTGNYLLNYPDKGGLRLRVFAGKFGYIGNPSVQKRFGLQLYQPKLTAVRGFDDYTYSNYFFGRSESEGFNSKQIMERDGFLKIRTDLFQDLQGRSENWIAAMNLSSTLPAGLAPVPLPLRLFLDVGTYAGAWKQGSPLPRFLYVGGIQVVVFKGLINIYAPLIMSREFSDNLKTVPEEDGFLKRISFSIDIQRFNVRRALYGNKLPY